MDSKPLVSVIMGVYNQLDKKILTEAVNSILNQTVGDFEFIIYDDGSCREAALLLKEIAASDDRVDLIGQEQNMGLAFSLNACISRARGKYIARMDADDISYPDRFAKQIAFLEANRDYSWCGTCADLMDSKGIWGRRNMPEYPSEKDYLKYSPYIHPSVMYRADIFKEQEGYLSDESTLRCEDYEIFMRFREKGIRGANIQEALLAYREDENSYAKRTVKHRWNEALCRYRNFKALGILWPFGWVFVLRPLVAILVPGRLIGMIKRLESHRDTNAQDIAARDLKDEVRKEKECEAPKLFRESQFEVCKELQRKSQDKLQGNVERKPIRIHI